MLGEEIGGVPRGGFVAIENLLEHDNEEIRERAQGLIDRYWITGAQVPGAGEAAPAGSDQ